MSNTELHERAATIKTDFQGTTDRDAAHSNRLPILAADIRTAHADCRSAAKTVVARAIDAGRLLLEAKQACPHGQWLPWLREHCELSPRQAQKYMRVARHADKNAPESYLTLSSALDAIDDRDDMQRVTALDRDVARLRAELDRLAAEVETASFSRLREIVDRCHEIAEDLVVISNTSSAEGERLAHELGYSSLRQLASAEGERLDGGAR